MWQSKNPFFFTKDVVYEREGGTAEILKGLSVQLAENSDTYVVEDYRSE